MARQNAPLLAFNRGIVSTKALARVDLERLSLSAEEQTNWMPRTLGSMTLRPGLGFIGSTLNDQPVYSVPFIFSTDDTAILEFTPNKLRIWANDQLVTRDPVTASVTNGGFINNLSGWIDADESGATSEWAGGNFMSLIGTGPNSAIRRQEVQVSEPGALHGINILIANGPVNVRIGTTIGGDELISFSAGKGSHSIGIRPNANFFIELSSDLTRQVVVESIEISASGNVELDTIYGADDLSLIRPIQSADVVFVACFGKRQIRIERRNNNSWSIIDYDAVDGPFDIINSTSTTITPSAISGNITLTASSRIFNPNVMGGIYRLDSLGQTVSSVLSSENTFTDDIRVTGTGATRSFTISLIGTFGLVVTLQRSFAEPGNWLNVQDFAGAEVVSFNDTLDNQIIFYRIGFQTGNYTSGSVTASLISGSGTATGVARVTGFVSETVVNAEVIEDLGNTSPTDLWYEGLWSPRRGYPSSCTLFEGRLWWAGKNYIYGSVSDNYSSFDINVEGDSGPIIRIIGFGPVDNINWLLSLQRIVMGTSGSAIAARSSSFDEPLTPTQFNLKNSSTQGSALVDAVQIDNRGLFVHRTGNRLIELVYDGAAYEYQPQDQMLLVPDLAASGIKRLAIQRQPDTRVHAVLNNGDSLVYITDPAESVKAWIKIETDGLIEDVIVLPGLLEDSVSYVVNRNGLRFYEKWALESECIGANVNKQADSFIQSTGQVITSLDRLEGQSVIVWADGLDIGSFTVTGGSIDLGQVYTDVIVGLKYTALYKSSKLAYAAQQGTALTQRKRVTEIGLIMENTHAQGVKYGTDINYLDALPREEGGRIVDPNFIWDQFDAPSFAVNGSIISDERLYLQAEAPRPCTILAAVPTVVTYEKS
tara:strand:- start:3449 stop:6082 length:2634 start_codon:yes stop_codon:yes gene_type:complete